MLTSIRSGNDDSQPSSKRRITHPASTPPVPKPARKPSPLDAIKQAKTFEERCVAVEAAMKEGLSIEFLRQYLDSL